MDPLIHALLVVGWGLFSLWVGSRAMHRARPVVLKLAALPVISALTFFAPLADEIVGAFQFERYCAAANHVPIYATIPVGEELYFPDGRWRLSEPALSRGIAETNRLFKVVSSYLEYERATPRTVVALMSIGETHHRIRNRRTGELLTEYRSYYTNGGWLSRHAGAGPTLVESQCFPEGSLKVASKLLTFSAKGGEK